MGTISTPPTEAPSATAGANMAVAYTLGGRWATPPKPIWRCKSPGYCIKLCPRRPVGEGRRGNPTTPSPLIPRRNGGIAETMSTPLRQHRSHPRNWRENFYVEPEAVGRKPRHRGEVPCQRFTLPVRKRRGEPLERFVDDPLGLVFFMVSPPKAVYFVFFTGRLKSQEPIGPHPRASPLSRMRKECPNQCAH